MVHEEEVYDDYYWDCYGKVEELVRLGYIDESEFDYRLRKLLEKRKDNEKRL